MRGKILSSVRGSWALGGRLCAGMAEGMAWALGAGGLRLSFLRKKALRAWKRARWLHALSGALLAPLRCGGEREVRRAERGESAWSERAACLRGVPVSLISSLCSPISSLLSLGDDIPRTELRSEAHQGRESFSGLEALPLILTESARFHFSVTLLLLLSPFSAPASGERIPGDGGRVSLSPGRGEEVCGGEFPISGPALRLRGAQPSILSLTGFRSARGCGSSGCLWVGTRSRSSLMAQWRRTAGDCGECGGSVSPGRMRWRRRQERGGSRTRSLVRGTWADVARGEGMDEEAREAERGAR